MYTKTQNYKIFKIKNQIWQIIVIPGMTQAT